MKRVKQEGACCARCSRKGKIIKDHEIQNEGHYCGAAVGVNAIDVERHKVISWGNGHVLDFDLNVYTDVYIHETHLNGTLV